MKGVYLFFNEDNSEYVLPDSLTEEYDLEEEKTSKIKTVKNIKWYKDKQKAKSRYGDQSITKVNKVTKEEMSMIEIGVVRVDDGTLQKLLDDHNAGKLVMCMSGEEIKDNFDDNAAKKEVVKKIDDLIKKG